MSHILLIDLSSIAHMMFHVSGDDPNPDATSIKTLERVRALASGQPHVAICLDTPPYFRMTIDPTYKAKREKDNNAVIGHQIAVTADALRADGFPVWGAQGFEADDIIASATMMFHGAEMPSTFVIVSADKDLLQLVNERVSVKSLKDGSLIGPDEVQQKFGVAPHQIADYLTLVGDSSDNIKGAEGIGPKKAAALLAKFGNLDDVYRALDSEPSAFANSTITSLREFQPRMPTVRELIRLRTDVPLPFDEVFKERVAADVAVFGGEMSDERESSIRDKEPSETREATAAHHAVETHDATPVVRGDTLEREGRAGSERREDPLHRGAGEVQRDRPNGKDSQVTQAVTVREPDIVSAAPVEWERQLEPRSMQQAKQLAADLFASRLFSAYGNAPAVLSTILAGREFGTPTMASLRAFDLIDGKPAMKSDYIRAIVLRSGKAEYFRCTERTAQQATFITKRKGEPELSLTHTIEQSRRAWTKGDKAWDNSGHAKNPEDMNVARASAKLARLVYPDVTHGLYAPEEMD